MRMWTFTRRWTLNIEKKEEDQEMDKGFDQEVNKTLDKKLPKDVDDGVDLDIGQQHITFYQIECWL